MSTTSCTEQGRAKAAGPGSGHSQNEAFEPGTCILVIHCTKSQTSLLLIPNVRPDQRSKAWSLDSDEGEFEMSNISTGCRTVP